jgi:hypothetical protein
MKKAFYVVFLSILSSAAGAHDIATNVGFFTGLAHVFLAPDHLLLMLAAGIVMSHIDIHVFGFSGLVIGSLLVIHGFQASVESGPLFAYLAGVLGSSLILLLIGRFVGQRAFERFVH